MIKSSGKIYLCIAVLSLISFSALDSVDKPVRDIHKSLLKEPLKNKLQSTDKASLIMLYNTTSDTINLFYFDFFSDLTWVNLYPLQSFAINTEVPLWVIDNRFKHSTVYLLKPGDSLSASFGKKKDIILKPLNKKQREKEIDIFRYINSKLDKSYYEIIFDKSTSSPTERSFFLRDSILKERLSRGTSYLEEYITENKLNDEVRRSARNIIKLDYYSKTLLGLWNYKPFTNVACKHKNTFDSLYMSLQNDSLDYTGSPISYRNVKYYYFIRSVQFKISQNPFKKSEYQKPVADTLYKFAQSQSLDQNLLNNFLFLIVKDELSNYPKSTQSCLQFFFKDCKNDHYKKYINEIVLTSHAKGPQNSGDIFINAVKKRISFSEIINSFKGKIVYLDLWASWCIPCRSEFPYSFKLRKQYANKPIEFLYVSIDKNYNLWNSAIKQEKLVDFPNNYLLLDFENAEFTKRFKIGPIPRYIIFDKSGNVINAESPRPSENSIIKVLDSLLK